MRTLLFFIAFLIMLPTHAQERIDKKNQLLVVFYNTENLFDLTDNPDTRDEDFTPEGIKAWNEERYEEKLKHLAEVLTSIARNDLPSLIGLAEIENKQVLKDLARQRKLRRKDYRIVHYDSEDERGIDVALMYRPDRFEVRHHSVIRVPLEEGKTRDILHVQGRCDDGENYHVFVNHWPSRREGTEQSEYKRIQAAVELRKEVDHIFNRERDARILIMGDMNDEPTNRSVLNILNATNKRNNQDYRDLYNLMYDKHNAQGLGTLSHRGKWQMFDHLIVSFNLINADEGYSANWESGQVYKEDYLLYEDPNVGDLLPNRTYGGNKYYGGYSDHLPVYLILTKKEGR